MDYPKDKCVHTLFEEQVARTPDKVAVIACDKTLTYRELNEEANRIAHSLIERGVGVGDIVAFALPRKSYLISTMFGILKSGAAYLPVDPDCPQDRVDYMLQDSGAKLFITEKTIAALLRCGNTQNPTVPVSAERICYCIYTSGSTGKPKGVKIHHRNIVNLCQVSNQNRHSSSLDNGSIFLSMFNAWFDAFGIDYGWNLVNGKTVLFAADSDIGNAERLSNLISDYKADVIHTTPTVLSMLCENTSFLNVLSQIKVILVGAEVFDRTLFQKLVNNTKAVILNGYGPTETTIGACFGKIDSADITIGKPIANTQIYIVDRFIQPTPIGVTGELCIAGDGVGAGYLNRPELTAERFIDNPFGAGKLYKTGDLAYWREEGNIVYVGRNDFQVKIRGLRIELGEIESAMNAFCGVSQAVAVAQKDEQGRQYLVGYYVADTVIDEADLRVFIGKRLPKYMVPNYFCHLDALPMTASGKVNRKALPAVELSRKAEYAAPKTALQRQFCEAFAKTLGLERVGIADDFFELGGDSLRAIELLCNAQDLGIRFELQAIYEYPTVEALSAFLTKDASESVRIQPEQFEKYKPLLSKNTVPKYIPAKQPLGTVFLTGATGFLGAHVLDSLLTCDCEKVYCLVRQDSSRLWSELRYYFGNKYDNDARIIPVVGNLDTVGSLELPERIHFVIHTAANVKHYGNYADFYQTNVVGTQHVIEFAKRQQAILIHISTTSVSGVDIAGNAAARSEAEKSFSEAELYIGQTLENVYVRSKFFAECAVLDAALEGLPVNIVRVGNLTNRRSDGLFQPNYETNAFLKRLKAILELGCFPDYLMDLYSEFSPIDDTAEAIVKIAEHFTPERTVYHVYNNKHLYFKDMLPMLESLGVSMEVVSDKEFTEKLMKASDSAIRQALINDLDADGKWVLDSNIRIQCSNTVEYLEQLGFTWHSVDYDYLKRYYEFFRRNGYLS